MRNTPLLIVIAVVLTGCAGLTQMQDTINKFNQGTHYLNTAQMSLFHQVQEAECNRNFYSAAFKFATKDTNELDLIKPCKNEELTDDQLIIRQKLMDTITLYADAIQTLANGEDDKNLSTNSIALANSINSLAANNKFSAILPSVAGAFTPVNTAALNTAVVTITNLILDHKKYKEIKDAASGVQKDLSIIVDELKNENTNDVIGIISKKQAVTNEYRTAVLESRNKNGVASLFDIIAARNNILATFPSPQNADQLNKALDALVAANQALANTKEGGAIPAISDLISRAQQAVTLFNSSKSFK